MDDFRSVVRRCARAGTRFILGIFFVVGLLGFLGILALAGIYFFYTPDASALQNMPLAQTSTIYDRTGEHVLYELHGEENRQILAHDQISEAIRKATIASEDSNFYGHHGIDFTSIVRALIVDIRAGRIEQGGSTITQQLARNAFFSRERTVKRKVLETVTAFKIENTFSKDEILDMYLNRVPYGSNSYGIGTASKTYFGKSAQDISLDEAALLASLTRAPSLYSPYAVSNSLRTVNARNNTIRRMNSLGMISDTEMENALAVDTPSKITPFTHPIQAPHFVFFALDQLEEKYGREAIETGGWKIYTTLDWDMQQQAEKSVREGAKRNLSRNASNAALTAVDPKTGEVLAMVGSKDFYDTSIDGEVNVTLRPRQPGSSFKPFAYATAFEKGFQPETLLTDKRIDFGPDGSGKDYVPRNYDGKFHGTMPMRYMLAQSLNIPAVQTLYLAGIRQTIDMAHRLGITTLNDVNRYGLALVLGGGEVKLLDMTSAFGTFGREGVHAPAHGILRIDDRSGNRVDTDISRGISVLDPEVARKINSILSDNKARTPIFGPNSPLILPDRPVAAKTGTTQDFHDAWTIGYTPSLAVGVWAGNNNNDPMTEGSDGVFVAAPIWNDFMRAVTKGTPVESFRPYSPVSSDKLLLTGKRDGGSVKYFDVKSGKELSEEKAAKKDPDRVRVSFESEDGKDGRGGHSILYYVNKNDPLGNTPPDFSDPMLSRWEGKSEEDDAGSDDSSSDKEAFISAQDYYGYRKK